MAVVWEYFLDGPMDGKSIGWHPFSAQASQQLEQAHHQQAALAGSVTRTTWHLKSDHFTYEVNLREMTQRNMKTGKVRPIRRAAKAAVWEYFLDGAMDGKSVGWHPFSAEASKQLETAYQQQSARLPGQPATRTTWHLQSDHFTYEVNLREMTQRNMETGKVRPIRRVEASRTTTIATTIAPAPPLPVVAPEEPAKKKTKTEPVSAAHKNTVKTEPVSAENNQKKTVKTEPQADEPKKQTEKTTPRTLGLEALFAGAAPEWESAILPFLEAQPRVEAFVGASRDRAIVPARELTFQALKANPPSKWRVVVFGQHPYPRAESATGIALFDARITDWGVSAFGATPSMRCVVKAAAMAKFYRDVDQDLKIDALRSLLRSRRIVTPPQWFQALLAQGVLFLNAALTAGGEGTTKAHHAAFWKPIVAKIVDEICRAKAQKQQDAKKKPHQKLVFLWWGADALRVKKALTPLFDKYAGFVDVRHVEHCNPAAQGDKFCDPPAHFKVVDAQLDDDDDGEKIDWLPSTEWLAENPSPEHAAFVTETQLLHEMYLARLEQGLEQRSSGATPLAPITGISQLSKVPLPEACAAIGLSDAAQQAVYQAISLTDTALDYHQAAAISLYTGHALYRRLNEALRNPDRKRIVAYALYLRRFLDALDALKDKEAAAASVSRVKTLYRGIRKLVASEYEAGADVTWWSVSSCTPNLDVARGFAAGGTVFHVEAVSAVPIMHLSMYKGEEEWVLAPGTQLTVLAVTQPSKRGAPAVVVLRERHDKPRLVD